MNWKIVFIGGLVYYVTMFVLSFASGYFIHEGILAEVYKAHAEFWRPELNMEPPDMLALMKIWVPTGLLSSFIGAGIYSVIRGSLAGAAWKRGLKFGVIASLFAFVNALGYWGVFNLPNQIWQWWLIDATYLHLLSGIVLGIVAQKLAPAGN